MSTLTSRARAAVLAVLTIAGAASVLLGASAEPATALCKYGTPHCVDPHKPKLPEVGGAKIPDSGWVDPDCKYYGNCLPDNKPEAARRAQARLQAAGKPLARK
ncbi:MAG: hypothetical protein QOI12_4590 [Alphaproteobacteria bacterium]|jgi:hypothetical protein|nr:hypothetical protein [Alphaproteobacteria bacterium]